MFGIAKVSYTVCEIPLGAVRVRSLECEIFTPVRLLSSYCWLEYQRVLQFRQLSSIDRKRYYGEEKKFSAILSRHGVSEEGGTKTVYEYLSHHFFTSEQLVNARELAKICISLWWEDFILEISCAKELLNEEYVRNTRFYIAIMIEGGGGGVCVSSMSSGHFINFEIF